MTIRDALLLRDYRFKYGDHAVTVRRPSALDLIEALEVSKQTPERLHAWLVMRHLVEDGRPVFDTIEDVLASDAGAVAAIAASIEKLYGEGRD